MTGRVVWLRTSRRVAPDLLTWRAWQTLRAAEHVLASRRDHPLVPALEAAGITVQVPAEDTLPELPTDPPIGPMPSLLEIAASGAVVVWLADEPAPGEPDPGPLPPTARPGADSTVGTSEVEVLTGSHDLPGGRLLDVVAVMDRLRRTCPWDGRQTHRSLARYLVEETYEALEALESGTAEERREELGDLLYQVVFHARIGAEAAADDGWTIDDLARGLAAKLVRRHPHVFAADAPAADLDEVVASWETLKAAEKPDRAPLDGVPLALPALALADKVLGRLDRTARTDGSDGTAPLTAAALGEQLLDLVRRARVADLDPEQALRDAVRHLIACSASPTARSGVSEQRDDGRQRLSEGGVDREVGQA